MKKILMTLLWLLSFAFGAFAQTEYSVCLYDSLRSRVIPVAVYSPAKTNRHTGVVVFSHGYHKNKDPQSHRRYAYLNRYLAEKGYYVISIHHERPDDPQMPLT
ncbi:MAG: alpha/beta hydrolase, partial [Alistipes sp.]|nr:alpha/beta hydrolase [Alistipes sp.]